MKYFAFSYPSFSLLVFVTLSWIGCDDGQHVPTKVYSEANSDLFNSVHSPCQCRAGGGTDCTLNSQFRKYFDGTAHEDYDAWGYYEGEMEVPMECRRVKPKPGPSDQWSEK